MAKKRTKKEVVQQETTQHNDLQALNELKEVLINLSKTLEKVEEEKTKKVERVDLRELMMAIKEYRWDDVDKMKSKLEAFLMYAPTKDRKDFAWDIVYHMEEWGKDLRAVDKLRDVLVKMFESTFNEYYEWIEEMKDQADRLSDAIERLYDKLSG
jgi:uncharacterized protein YukE